MKSQLLYLGVYCTRYLDLLRFHIFTSLDLYNFVMKIFFIGSQLTIVHAMMYKYRASYNPRLDSFRVEIVVLPCLVLALLYEIYSHTFHNHRSEGLFRVIFEVKKRERLVVLIIVLLFFLVVLLGFFYSFGIDCHPPSNVPTPKDR